MITLVTRHAAVVARRVMIVRSCAWSSAGEVVLAGASSNGGDRGASPRGHSYMLRAAGADGVIECQVAGGLFRWRMATRVSSENSAR